jgi:hypothetical protein
MSPNRFRREWVAHSSSEPESHSLIWPAIASTLLLTFILEIF